jgi:hypothetical protein
LSNPAAANESLINWLKLKSFYGLRKIAIRKNKSKIAVSQCFHNRLFKNPFTISKIPFFPQNFLATKTVKNTKKIQTRNRASLHCLKIWASFQEFPP